MWKRLIPVAVVLALAWPTSGDAQTLLKVASFIFPKAELNTQVIGPFVDAVNADLKGAVTLKLFAGGSLGRNPVQQYKLLRNKIAEIAYIVQGYTPGEFRDVSIFDLPFLVESSLEGSVGHWRLNAKGLMRGYDNVKVIALFTLPGYTLHSTKPVTKIGDL